MAILKFFAGFVFWLAFLSVPVSSLHAQDERYLANYHHEFGLKLYHDGKLAAAADRFVRALLLDPAQDAAKGQLQKLSGDSRFGDPLLRLRVLRFLDSVEYRRFLESRKKGLQATTRSLIDFIRQNDAAGQFIAEIDTIQIRFEKNSNAPKASGAVRWIEQSGLLDLKAVNTSFEEDRDNLIKEIDEAEQIHRQLKAVKSKVMEGLVVTRKKAVAGQWESELGKVKTQLAEKDNLLVVHRNNIEYFKNELALMRESFNALQEKLKNTDEKVVELTKELARMSLELFEKNRLLVDKESRAAGLEQELADAQERLILVQRLIQEKDEQIGVMEQRVIEIARGRGDGGMADLKLSMKDLKTEVDANLETNRQKIESLEQQLTDLHQKYSVLTEQVKARDTEIARMKDIINDKDSRISDLTRIFSSKDAKLVELNGIIDIYRSKLKALKSQHPQPKAPGIREDQTGKDRGSALQQREAVSVPDLNPWSTREVLDRTRSSIESFSGDPGGQP